MRRVVIAHAACKHSKRGPDCACIALRDNIPHIWYCWASRHPVSTAEPPWDNITSHQERPRLTSV